MLLRLSYTDLRLKSVKSYGKILANRKVMVSF